MTLARPNALLIETRVILSLCDYSGAWSQPYLEAGYDVRRVDLKTTGDVRLLEYPGPVHGILASPPCTHFAGSGARWWEGKPDSLLVEALSVVDACLRLVVVCDPAWWALENPIGRLNRWLGNPAMYFDPCDYGGYADDPDSEGYTKRTALWGRFQRPAITPVPPHLGSMMHLRYGGRSERTKTLRSVTPSGFARAFMEANP